MLDRWIRAQRVGIAAYRLGVSAPMRFANDNRSWRTGLSDVLAFLEQELAAGEEMYRGFMPSLPPLTLDLLSSIPKGLLEGSQLIDLQPEWKRLGASKLGLSKEKGAVPQFIAARILAYHILQGTGKPISVIRLAKSVLGHGWRQREENETLLEILESVLEILRSPGKETPVRVDAIETISRALATVMGRRAWRAAMVAPTSTSNVASTV